MRIHHVQIDHKARTSSIVRSKPVSLKGESKFEIERRFVIDLKDLPKNFRQYPHHRMEQGYFFTKNGTSLRLRKFFDDNYYEMTIKIGTQRASTRYETGLEIPEKVYKALWEETKGARLEKTRYEIPYGSYTIELDIYHGDLKGFCTAEVEFNSQTECDRFIPPPWFTLEVTGKKEFTNKSLAMNGVPKRLLKRLL